MKSFTLSQIADLSQIIVAIVTVLAVPIAIGQFREAIRIRYFDSFNRVFQYFDEEASPSERKYVYDHGYFYWEDCSEDEKSRIERIIGGFQKVAYMANKGMMPKGLIVQSYYGPYSMAWERLQPYISERREKSGQPNWCIDFEVMASLSRRHAIKNLKIEPFWAVETKIHSKKSSTSKHTSPIVQVFTKKGLK